jgi:mono/diheme cytochrome c family protein
MPAFKAQLTRDEVWAIVEYVKTLRKAPAGVGLGRSIVSAR